MNRELAESFFTDARSVFAFLVHEHGFGNPEFTVDDEINFAYVTFTAAHLVIECVCDEREEQIECRIAAAGRSGAGSGIEFDSNGARVRERLYQWAIRHGLRENPFRKVGSLPFRQRIRPKLEDFASLLKKYGAEIIQDSPDALN